MNSWLSWAGAVSAAGFVVACSNAEGLDSEDGGGVGNFGGPSPERGDVLAPDSRDGPSSTGSAGPVSVACGASLSLLPLHRVSSPTYALSALAVGAWPDKADMTHLDASEFLTYFSLPPAAVGYAVETGVDGAGQRALEVFGDATSAPLPQHYVLVVDTSVSMRNELGVAASLVSALSSTLLADSGDTLTIVEWGTNPRSFDPQAAPTGADANALHTVGAADAPALGEAFAAYLTSLEEAQLGPGGSLGAAGPLVQSILKEGGPAPHVVVVSDGGLPPDSDTLGAVSAWSELSAIVSFVEVRSATSALGSGHHAELWSTLGRAGGGVTLFVNDATVSDRAAELDRLLRPAAVGDVVTLTGPFDASAGTGDELSKVVPWVPAGRPVHTPAIASCALSGEDIALTFGPPSLPVDTFVASTTDERATAVGHVLSVVHALQTGCAAVPDLPDLSGAPLCAGLSSPGYCALPAMIDAMKAACP